MNLFSFLACSKASFAVLYASSIWRLAKIWDYYKKVELTFFLVASQLLWLDGLDRRRRRPKPSVATAKADVVVGEAIGLAIVVAEARRRATKAGRVAKSTVGIPKATVVVAEAIGLVVVVAARPLVDLLWDAGYRPISILDDVEVAALLLEGTLVGHVADVVADVAL